MPDVAVAPPPLRLAQLYRPLCGFVRGALRGHGVAPADVDDLTQDVFVTMHRRAAGFESERAARAWLYATARRVASNHRRGRRRSAHRDRQAPVPCAVPDPHEALSHDRTLAAVQREAESLTPDARAVLDLAMREGCSGPTIAARLGIPLNTAYSHLRRVRSRLAKVAIAVALLTAALLSMLAGSCSTEGTNERVALRQPALPHARASAAGLAHDHRVRADRGVGDRLGLARVAAARRATWPPPA